MSSDRPVTTRFAPSPTGLLHLGSGFAALIAYDLARAHGGRFVLRIENIDHGRCKKEFEHQILDDLAWLGLTWETPVRRQSEHMDLYQTYLQTLIDRGLTYRCFCTRKDIAKEIAQMPSAPHGPEGPIYPGTCRELSEAEVERRIDANQAFAWRLDWQKALAYLQEGGRDNFFFNETGAGPKGETGHQSVDPGLFGDIIIARKDVGVSYHLAVTVDDHLQDITLVTRGNDLFPASHIQRLLQAVAGVGHPRLSSPQIDLARKWTASGQARQRPDHQGITSERANIW